MKQNQKYFALFFWGILCLFLFYQYYSNSLVKSKEQKAISSTNQKIRNLIQELHQNKLEKTDLYIKEHGNNPRDIRIYNNIKNASSSIENLYKTDKINLVNLKSSLTDSASNQITTQIPNPTNNKSETLKDIYKTNLYQNAYHLLSQEYYKINDFGFGFYKTFVLNSSDTTLGFYPLPRVGNYTEIPKTTIQFINQKDTTKSDWKLQFDKNFTKPIIFQVNTHTKTGSIEKRYQITPKENQKLQPFDYQEIE